LPGSYSLFSARAAEPQAIIMATSANPIKRRILLVLAGKDYCN
jgi:hypothetical protein